MPSGRIPDDLLTDDLTGWTTLQGSIDKTAYLACINALDTLFATPLAFTIDSLTADDNRVVAEARSEGILSNGESYRNTYIFVFRIRDGRIAAIAEHYNALTVHKKLIPLMTQPSASATNKP